MSDNFLITDAPKSIAEKTRRSVRAPQPAPLPPSPRTRETEQRYQDAKRNGGLKELWDEPRLHEFNHWYVIANRFPYDALYGKHDMLLPRRLIKSRFDLNDKERDELDIILEYFVEPNYDAVMDNMQSKRSVKKIHHLHLLAYKEVI